MNNSYPVKAPKKLIEVKSRVNGAHPFTMTRWGVSSWNLKIDALLKRAEVMA